MALGGSSIQRRRGGGHMRETPVIGHDDGFLLWEKRTAAASDSEAVG